jgi:hypothetical protein
MTIKFHAAFDPSGYQGLSIVSVPLRLSQTCGREYKLAFHEIHTDFLIFRVYLSSEMYIHVTYSCTFIEGYKYVVYAIPASGVKIYAAIAYRDKQHHYTLILCYASIQLFHVFKSFPASPSSSHARMRHADPKSTNGTKLGRPCAHWKGNAQRASRRTRCSHSPADRTSLNIMAP